MMKYRDRLMKKVSFDDVLFEQRCRFVRRFDRRCRLVLFCLRRGVALPGVVVLLEQRYRFV